MNRTCSDDNQCGINVNNNNKNNNNNNNNTELDDYNRDEIDFVTTLFDKQIYEIRSNFSMREFYFEPIISLTLSMYEIRNFAENAYNMIITPNQINIQHAIELYIFNFPNVISKTIFRKDYRTACNIVHYHSFNCKCLFDGIIDYKTTMGCSKMFTIKLFK